MKILFLTTAFNGLAQRAWIELDRLNHQVKVQIASDAEAMVRATTEFQPELIVAPFLKKKIPEQVWKNYRCLVVHPGIPGDRGASSLDWAILNGEKEWGVSILEAVEKMDAGAVWASAAFPMRAVSKACLYRHEVTQAAAKALLTAIKNIQTPGFRPTYPDDVRPDIRGRWNRSTQASDYRFEWTGNTADILNKIRAADSDPGAPVQFFGEDYFAFGGHPEERLTGPAGQIIARRDAAICVATGDKALWLTHLKPDRDGAIKLPATLALGEKAAHIACDELSPFEWMYFNAVSGRPTPDTFQEIRYREEKETGYIWFDFYNGAMSTDQCRRLRQTIIDAKKRPVKVIVLMGGTDVWSNGIHLNVIEQAENPADESWRNIQAIDDLILEIIESPDHYVISALQGNAGAGGVPLALAADKVLARQGIVLNPHTKNMGLYGSEYWTYLLPQKIGIEKARQFTDECLPWGTAVAKEIGLIDDVFGETAAEFCAGVEQVARDIARLPYFDKLLQAKRFQRKKDERIKPLAQYRAAELERMRVNFYENDAGYDEKRFRFVHKIYDPRQEQTLEDRDWYSSRRKIYRRRKWESVEYGQ